MRHKVDSKSLLKEFSQTITWESEQNLTYNVDYASQTTVVTFEIYLDR